MLPKHWFELTTETDSAKIVDEFVKKYKDCYVWMKTSPEKPPLLVRFLNYSGDNFYFDYQGSNISCVLDTSVQLMVKFPNTGAFTFENNYAVFSRVPARQFKRAPTGQNCSITFPKERLYAGRGVADINEESLSAAFNKKHISWDKAVAQIKSGKQQGVAINNFFGVTASQEEHSILWYLQFPIGFVKENKIDLRVTEFKQEVLDFLRDSSIEGVTIEEGI